MKNFLSALQTPSELRIEKSGEKIPGRKINLFRPDYKFIRPEGDSEIAVEKLNIYDAVEQSKNDARTGEMPVVMHRKNRKEWLVTMPLDDWMELYER